MEQGYTEGFVKDVLGPLPADNSSLAIFSVGGKIFPIQAAFSDADMCFNLLNGLTIGSPNPYEFLAETFEKVSIGTKFIKLEMVAGSAYSKIVLIPKEDEKPLKLVTHNAMTAVNFALATKKPLLFCQDIIDYAADFTDAYMNLKATVGILWPLPQLTSTRCMEALHEFIAPLEPPEA